MLTKNGKLFLGAVKTNDLYIFKDFNGDDYSQSPVALKTIDSQTKQPRQYLLVGSNNTLPTEDDFSIEEITSLTKINNTAQAVSFYEDNYIMMVSSTYINNTSSAINIKELGFVYSYSDHTILFAREVVNVTIPAGETKTFTIKIG